MSNKLPSIARHPKGLYLLFLTEMWERFSYYGMRAILVLYLTAAYVRGGLGFTEENASLLYGLFTGFVYFTPLIGGWLADRFIGQRRSITIGSLIMLAGQLCLAASTERYLLYCGLVLLILGNGFFKPNISVMVGDLYPEGDSRRDGAYTIFYMGINVGAFCSSLLVGWLSVKYGFRSGFLASAIGLAFGLLFYQLLSPRLLGEIGLKPKAPLLEQRQSVVKTLTHEERSRSAVILILTLFSVAFFAGYEQAGSSMTLFAEKYVDRMVGGFEVPTAWLQALNPLLIVVLAPVMSLVWVLLGSRGKEPAIPIKMGWGLVLLGLGFVVLLGAVWQRGGDVADTAVKANIGFMVGAYFLHTVGELCLSPIGLSMVNRLSPVSLASLMMGVWLASSFVANMLAGYLAAFASRVGASVIFWILTVSSLFFGTLLIALNKWLVKNSYGRL
ncbi:MAG: peptide MFS transporter [Paludibacteraceae bacterium]|nr:peptide MFS transporter [Paludibacteraceae bacterium]